LLQQRPGLLRRGAQVIGDAATSTPETQAKPTAVGEAVHLEADEFRPLVLLPSYNNATKLRPVLDAVCSLDLPTLLVDDGSTDGTAQVVQEFLNERDVMTFHQFRHAVNRGKGAALRTGFLWAAERGFTHAICIDTDGQHDVADAPALLAASEAEPTALVIGCRNANDPAYPKASRIGRRWANLTILLSSGRRVEDSQSGYRVYPIGLTQAVRCISGRYGYEGEMLIRSGWADTPLVEVPIRVIYPPRDQRISHFRPWRDTLHTYMIYGLLSLRAVIPWPYVKWPPPEQRKREDRPKRSWWKRLLNWADPRELIRQVRADEVSRMRVAAGLGVGVLVANIPIYPVQTLFSLYLAKRLHLHPLAAVLGSQAAFPPMGAVLSFAAIYVGRLLLTGQPPAWSDFEGFTAMSWSDMHVLMRSYFFAWWIGGILLGLILGWATFLICVALFRYIPSSEEVQED
jgi:glycosyltransferase involved in cell wall biosynthesis